MQDATMGCALQIMTTMYAVLWQSLDWVEVGLRLLKGASSYAGIGDERFDQTMVES